MQRYAVYVPSPDAPPRLRAQVAAIDPGSAIVGGPDRQTRRLLVYYEGNHYHAANIVTFADRAMIAAGRLSRSYPTVARRLVDARALITVGWFTAAHGVDVEDATGLLALARWLGLGDGPQLDSDALRRELRLSR